ncbi:apolipoprotein N-acyltransferase [mine drainage metagenome]|uniref:Apolipoprotein N-acyltransferase n=1 Tax=mine drainage metagenome TaxID=410659 RepID=A0A1J5QVB4_9ZZZZ
MKKFPHLSAVLLGALAVVGYAPFYCYPVSILALAGLFHLWRQAGNRRQGFLLGYCFGLGMFGTGVSWIYVSLHVFGAMPLAAAAFATAAFCAFIALFPAIAGWVSVHFGTHRLQAMPFAWVLMEWVLNWIFTGFPWMTLGNSQVPYSPLAGFAPLLGVFGVSLLAAIVAALIVAVFSGGSRRPMAVAILVIWVAGSLLKLVEWSAPAGQPISVSLLQGNIAQDMKWQEAEVARTLATYLDLARRHPAELVVLPETALPMLLDQVPAGYRAALAKAGRGDVLAGVVESRDGRYYNSMASMEAGRTQIYRKDHLVPFGEFIPLKGVLGWIYNDLLHIPLTDLASGGRQQRPLDLAGQKVAVDICYEDVFGEEIIRQLPEATLLVNASNDAWYGNSFAAHQHLQMSQVRALETGRMMLRATNTGATAIIDRHGYVLAEAPHFAATALTGRAQGYGGATPYVRFGNWPAISLIFLALGVLWRGKKK